MKSFFVVTLCSCVNLCAQSLSQDWIDLSNKSDAEIIRTLERIVITLAESPASEASERVRLLQMQQSAAKQSFDQNAILLEGKLSSTVAAKEAAEKILSDMQADSTALDAQLDLCIRSQQRLRERLDKFPFKAVLLAKAAYNGDLRLVKEKMLYEAGRLAIEKVNGIQIISETLVKNQIFVRDIIEGTVEGKADCQPRELKTLENGIQRVIYLYGIYDIYPLSASIKLSNQAAALQLPIETHFIQNEYDASLAKLPINIRQEIRAMLSIADQANVEVRNNLNTLVQQELQLLHNSGVNDKKDVLMNKIAALRLQISSKRMDLISCQKAYTSTRQKFLDHLNSEQRIETVTQSDLEHNRSQDVIKAGLIRDCLTQFRTTVKTLYSQEKDKVVNFQLVESSSPNVLKQVHLLSAKILGIYLSPSEGDIKYTVSVAFRFGFDYVLPTQMAQKETDSNLDYSKSPLTTLSDEDQNIEALLKKNDFYDKYRNQKGKGIANNFELQRGNKVILDRTSGLMWQRGGSSIPMPFADALNYIRQLNIDKFAGFNDWRLPTLQETMTLMEPKQMSGDLYISPVFEQKQQWIWTMDRGGAGGRWIVNFSSGYCSPTSIDVNICVRAVR